MPSGKGSHTAEEVRDVAPGRVRVKGSYDSGKCDGMRRWRKLSAQKQLTIE